jgi:hypothetical protein
MAFSSAGAMEATVDEDDEEEELRALHAQIAYHSSSWI